MEPNEQTALVPRSAAAPVLSKAGYWMERFEQALHFSAQMLKTGFLGQHIKTPEQAVMIMMAGDELDLPPTVAWRDLHVIHGQIGMKAKLMLAQVLRSPVCKYFQPVGEPTAEEATFETWRAGSPTPVRRTFRMADAELAGYVKQNPKYKTDPKAMLSARCITILCESIYPDLTRGMASEERLLDEGPNEDHPRRAMIEVDVGPLGGTPAAPPASAAAPAPAAPAAPAPLQLQPTETIHERAARWGEALRAARDEASAKGITAEIAKAIPDKADPTRRALVALYNERKAANWAPLPAEPPHDPVTGEVREPGAEG